MTICFDIDDTISTHLHRDYKNATPIMEVLDKIRALKGNGCSIILYTARGMLSCNGDASLAESKNRAVLEQWLKENNVPYDDLVFGKPLADFYVDDKALRPEELVKLQYGEIGGFSGDKVIRAGDFVVKETKDSYRQCDWYAKANQIEGKTFYTPKVFSSRPDSYCMEYIGGGVCIADYLSSANVDESRVCLTGLKNIVSLFGSVKSEGENDVDSFIAYVEQRSKEAGLGTTFSERERKVLKNRLREKTFCHGDLSCQNVITSCGRLYLIDPGNYLLLENNLIDAAKIRASLCGLDDVITGKSYGLLRYIEFFDYLFEEDEETIRILQKSHYIRVLRYADKKGDFEKVEKLKEMICRGVL